MLMRCIVYKLMGPCGPMVKALVFTRNMCEAFLLLASVVTTRLSRLESWQGRLVKKPRRLLPGVCFVFPALSTSPSHKEARECSARDYSQILKRAGLARGRGIQRSDSFSVAGSNCVLSHI